MKKALLIFLIVAMVMCLAGCGSSTSRFGFTVIRTMQHSELVYDPETKVVYIYIYGPYRAGISPYYIIGEDGKPEIAVYGVNYGIDTKEEVR